MYSRGVTGGLPGVLCRPIAGGWEAQPQIKASPAPPPSAPPPNCSYNKQVLKTFPHPLTITAFQFFIGSLVSLTMWTLGLHKKPQASTENVSRGMDTQGSRTRDTACLAARHDVLAPACPAHSAYQMDPLSRLEPSVACIDTLPRHRSWACPPWRRCTHWAMR